LKAIKVFCSEEEPVENSIKKFKRAVNQSGHLMEMRYRESQESTADKKKRKIETGRLMRKIERTNDIFERKAFGGNDYNK
jgi:small subunit ribosomal protein S21